MKVSTGQWRTRPEHLFQIDRLAFDYEPDAARDVLSFNKAGDTYLTVPSLRYFWQWLKENRIKKPAVYCIATGQDDFDIVLRFKSGADARRVKERWAAHK